MDDLIAEQKKLAARREFVFATLQRTYAMFEKIKPDQVNLHRPRFHALTKLEANFHEIQTAIAELNTQVVSPAKVIEIDKVQESFETVLFTAQARFLEADELKQRPDKGQSGHQPTSVKPIALPVIDLPKFNGEICKWPEFYNLFTSLIDDNKQLSNVQKLHYLKTSLSEQPLALISEFPITEENYPLALKALVTRYQNQRLLGSLYVQKILDFVPLKTSSYDALQAFLRTHRNSVESLKALNIPDLGDFLLLCLALANLDVSSRKAFEAKQTSNSTPNYKSLIDFLEDQSRTLELCAVGKSPNALVKSSPSSRKVNTLLVSSPVSNNRAKRILNDSSRSAQSTTRTVTCPLCNAPHSLYQCDAFRNLNVNQRYDTLCKLKRCLNCMGAHLRPQCNSTKSCSVCHSNRHHSMLHSDPTPSVEEATPGSDQGQQMPQTLSCHVRASNPTHQTVILGTVRAFIRDAHGNLQPFRAVIDSGSQISAITNSLVQRLGLKVMPTSTQLSGVGQAQARVHGIVQCNIASRLSGQPSMHVHAHVLSNIAGNLPTSSLPNDVIERYHEFDLADDRFNVPGPIDFLVGADLYPEILIKTGNTIVGSKPSALKTVFGWVILGPVNSSPTPNEPAYSFLAITNTSLEQSLRLFWETEEVNRTPPLNPLDSLVEEHFIKTHTRELSGRYSVGLPFKPDCIKPGYNRDVALKNFVNLERRLKRDPPTHDSYQEFMSEYAHSLHMQPAAHASEYIIPHHCVHKVTSSTTKLRVVFNASSPDSNGVALNHVLLSGPKLQGDLPCILTTFRTYPVALCADVRQMYRQILVHQDDRAYQHIFWRPEPSSPVIEYELNTVTYGLTSSAFQAQRVLKQLVIDDGAKYPLAARALTCNIYIDDIVSGANDLDEALALRTELQSLTQCAGVELRKWASNVPDALSSLPEEHLEIPLVFSNDEQGLKILGLLWDPRSDCFGFHTLPFDGCVTKRSVLSYIARIFDPLGFLTPFVSWMKVFMQKLWLSRVEWDESLPEVLAQTWLIAIESVSKLSDVRVPRLLVLSDATYRLVGFCDASEKAYAATLYLHVEICSQSHVRLLRARSKVAPVKLLTVPKLELCGALLLSRVLKDTLPALAPLQIEKTLLFTDSTIVLAWLTTPTHQLKTFVANRVIEILETTSPLDWAHVRSEVNPADCASRGLLPLDLVNHPIWFSGPPFLRYPPPTWSCSVPSFKPSHDLPELKASSTVLIIRDPIVNSLLVKLQSFSSLLRAKRVFGHVVRFSHILLARRDHRKPPSGPLLPSELEDAMNLFVRITQQHHYATELKQLAKHSPVSPRLSSLNPLIDSRGFLRVGGRLHHSSLNEEARHPLLLPKEAHLSSLLCDAFHIISLHSGPRTVQALIQQRYWIVSLRGLLRQRIRRCLTCFKFRAKPVQPLMADLPEPRVQPSRAFLRVGTDYAGPFSVKTSSRRNAPIVKGYLCLFICLATKAVHLEMVSDLSTEAFLACLDRFLSRRGLPAVIYSDCARNYVGAARTLREIHDFLTSAETTIADKLALRSVRWQFNPPYAPNFGGLWEAGVKSAKLLLYRLIKDSSLHFEEYATLFARIEAVLNSRPLCATSFDPLEGPDYLSPAHLLIGTSLLAPPEVNLADNSSHLSRWHRVRQLHQIFWTRWSSEYLHTQMQRGKWVRACPDLKVGDVVFALEPATTPLSWPIGRVIQVCPGKDNVVRVASIRTSKGVFTRPVNKLVVLPPS